LLHRTLGLVRDGEKFSGKARLEKGGKRMVIVRKVQALDALNKRIGQPQESVASRLLCPPA
jgi:hypothetical protein